MTRFEMPLKRKFLSRNNKWVVSVWNKGKMHSDGIIRDGKGPPWTVFFDGEEVEVAPVAPVENLLNLKIGILTLRGKQGVASRTRPSRTAAF